MITYIKGNLFSKPHPIIAHGCNAQGVMGSGVAKTIRKEWPKAFDDYLDAFIKQNKLNHPEDTPNLMMGRVIESYQRDGTIILNCITQKTYGSMLNIRYVSYDAIDKCMMNIAVSSIYVNKYIAMPKIGAGLGGGHWPVIESIINHRLKDVDVKVYHLE